MCYDNSNMPAFTATATWIWIKGLFGPGACLLVENIHHSHTVCGRGEFIKQPKKGEHFYIPNLLYFKSPTVGGLCPTRGWRTKDCTRRDDSSDKRVVWNFSRLQEPIFTGYMIASELWYMLLKCDLGFHWWNELHMRHILHRMLNN